MRIGSLFENLGIKILAVILALALYAHVVTEQTVEHLLYFPLEIDGLADSLALATTAPEELGAHVRGTGKQIIRLSVVRPAVVIHLDGVAAGQYQRALTAGDFKAVTQEGVEVLGPAEPAALLLHIEARATVRLPVAVRLSGVPAEGFALAGRPLLRPAEVKVSGPRSWVRGRDSVETEPVDLAGERDTLELVQPLLPPPPWATASPGSVLVRVPIEPEESGTAELVPQVRGLRQGVEALLDPPQVRVRWAVPRSRAGAERDLRAAVDAERRGRGRYVLPVEISGRGSAFVRAVEPESVSVVVQ